MKKIFRKIGLWLELGVGWLIGFCRSVRKNRIEQLWPIDDHIAGKVCIFSHFDRKGKIYDYVLYNLKSLKEAGFNIIFVSNSPKLDPISIKNISQFVSIILRRSNVGHDFGAYKDGISAIGDLKDIDQILLVNDGLYGPFWPLSDVLERMLQLKAHFWSLTDSWEEAYHLDSDFLLFGKEAIASAAFTKFWNSVRYVNSKKYIFRNYEVGLSRKLFKAGLRGGALCSYRDISHAVIESVRDGALNNDDIDDERKNYLRHMFNMIQAGIPFNLYAFSWDFFIIRKRYPFLKRELFQRGVVHAPYISHWQRVVAQVSDYDTDIIVRHLEATLKNRFT